MTDIVKHYQGEEHFVSGYVLQNMDVEYSLLHKSITWIGMSLMLASPAAWDTFIFGLATAVFTDETTASHSSGFLAKGATNYTGYTDGWNFDGSVFIWAGLVIALAMVIAGVAYVSIGRRSYRAY